MAAVLWMGAMVEVEVTVGMAPVRRLADFPDAPVVARRMGEVAVNEKVAVYAACFLTVRVSQEAVAWQ
jgi:hypothetical protein